MKNILAFEKIEDYARFEPTIDRLCEKLEEYQHVLEEKYALSTLPKGIVWTTEELATTVLSTVPIPAYTNKDVIYITPDLEAWRSLFVSQLEGHNLPNILSFYEGFSENDLLTILAHELTHHSNLFIDDFDDTREDAIWFEEGMCDYLARKTLLSETRFDEISKVESKLVETFKDKYRNYSLDEFGSGSYQGSLTSIMYNYWRSFLAVKYLVEVRANNDITEVFKLYHQWHNGGRKVPLTEFFELDLTETMV